MGAATVGTAAAAVVLSLLHASTRVVRAHRDEQQAATVGRDELTGAYTRRGFTTFVQRHLHEQHFDHGRADADTEPALDTTHAEDTRPNLDTDPPTSFTTSSTASSASGLDDGAGWSVALLDLNGFKAVNDTFGHDVGDQVLRTVTQRAAAVIEGHGILARFGGDEFVALLNTGSPSAPATQLLLRRLAEVIEQPATLTERGVVISVGVSIGAAKVPRRGRSEDLSAALKQADERMYTQKHRDRA